jgi:hypothetical protein
VIAPLGSQNFIHEPTQFSLLSEHHPSNCVLQFLKSLLQHGVSDGVGQVGHGVVGLTGAGVVGATGATGAGVVGTGGKVGPEASTVTSAQLKNCSGHVVLRVPSLG